MAVSLRAWRVTEVVGGGTPGSRKFAEMDLRLFDEEICAGKR